MVCVICDDTRLMWVPVMYTCRNIYINILCIYILQLGSYVCYLSISMYVCADGVDMTRMCLSLKVPYVAQAVDICSCHCICSLLYCFVLRLGL